jgi:hypothetical protein
MSDPQPSGDLRARVLAEASRTPAPTRGEHRKRVLILAALGALTTAALFFGMGGFAKGARPAPLVAFTAGFGLLASVVLTRLSVGVTGSMLGRPRSVLLLACIVLAPLLALVAFAASAIWPEHGAEGVPLTLDVACGALTLVQGALPLAFLILPRRGTDPVHPATTGAALGMTAGAWTAMMAYLRCPHAAAFHCIVAHVIPTLLLTVVGAVLGYALLKIRANANANRR